MFTLVSQYLEQGSAHSLCSVLLVDCVIPVEHGEVPEELLMPDCHSFVMSMLGRQTAATKSLQLCRLLVTPWTAALQAPPSLGFSRQEYWGGLPFPSAMHESEK